MTDERYKALMEQVGMPNSRSLLGALQQVANEVEQEVRAALAQPPAQPDRLYDALCWALGVGDDWKPRPDGAGPFYWRKELAERAGICWDGSRYVMAAQPVQQPTARTFADWVNSLTTEETHQFDAAGRGYKKDAHQMMRLAWGAAQAAPAQRQPLSDEQIDSLTFQFLTAELGPTAYDRAIARAIEAAHNITAAPAAQKGEKL